MQDFITYVLLISIILMLIYDIFYKKRVIFFFKPTCPYCVEFYPTWIELTVEIEGEAINGNEDGSSEMMSDYNVKSYPTIILKRGNDWKKYEGNRSKNDILEKLRNF